MVRKACSGAVVILLMLALASQSVARVPAGKKIRGEMLLHVPAGLLHCFRAYLASPGSSWGLVTNAYPEPKGCRRAEGNGFEILDIEDGKWTTVTAGDEVECPFPSRPGQPTIPPNILKSLTGKSCIQLPYITTGYTRRTVYEPKAITTTGDGSAFYAGETGHGIEPGLDSLGHLHWIDSGPNFADATGVEWVKAGPGATAVEHFHPEGAVQLHFSRPRYGRFTRMRVTERIFPHAVYNVRSGTVYFHLYDGYWASDRY